jgi:hypothetical protein
MVSRDDVIRMAREAGIGNIGHPKWTPHWINFFDKFAHLIASHVAEKCAAICDLEEAKHRNYNSKHEAAAIANVSEAIRSLYKPTD